MCWPLPGLPMRSKRPGESLSWGRKARGEGRRSEGSAAGFLVPVVVLQDLRVVEGDRGGKVRLAEQPRLGRVVAAQGGAFGPSDVDRRNRVVGGGAGGRGSRAGSE